MGLDRLIQAVAALAVLATLTGHLPQMIAYARKAQFQLIQDSKASKCPFYLLKNHRSHNFLNQRSVFQL